MWLQDSQADYANYDSTVYVPTLAAARFSYRAPATEAWSAYDKVREFCGTVSTVYYKPIACSSAHTQKHCGFLSAAAPSRDQTLAAAKQSYYNATAAWPGMIPGTRLRTPPVVTS